MSQRLRAGLASIALILATLWGGAAQAAPTIAIQARVASDLQTISGYMLVSSPERVRLVDPMAYLPIPTDDLQQPRTYPGATELGHVHFEEVDDGLYWFYAILPRRYGDLGSIRSRGLFANGGWYPQPLVAGEAPVVQWRVTVHPPPGTVAALGDRASTDVVRWSGQGERASLAVVPRGHITPIVHAGADVMLVTRGKPRRHLVKELRTVLAEAHPPGPMLQGVLVEAPLRRRLARPGLGMTYISDRAFRVSPGLSRFHRVAVARGVLGGLTPVSSPFERAIVAAADSEAYRQQLAGLDAKGLLAFGAWVPSIDALLYDRRLPFVSDVFEEMHVGDPLRDDLVERMQPHDSALSVVEQIRIEWGPDAVQTAVDALKRGANLEEAATLADVPKDFLTAWQQDLHSQDYVLEVDPVADTVTVRRAAKPQAPRQVVVIEVDGTRHHWVTGVGPDETTLPLGGAKRVRLDPDGLLDQASRLGDSWPAPYTVTAAAWLDELNLTHFSVAGTAAMWLRRRYDTHNVGSVTLFTDQENLVGGTLGYSRREGRLQDGRTRPHRFGVWVSPAILDPDFAPTDDGGAALGAGVSYSWDTRVSRIFPLRGHRLYVGTDGGFVPGSDQTWSAVRSSAAGVASVHPRLAGAARISGGIAQGEVEHRLLPLGGTSALRSLPPSLVIGTRRAVAQAEIRAAPVRGASVPAGFAWGTELQVTAGAEIGTAWVDEQAVHAAGITTGLAVVGDVLGMQPELIGATVAWPVWFEGFELPQESPRLPEISLRWWQEF